MISLSCSLRPVPSRGRRAPAWLLPLACTLLLVGCGSARHRAPVEERGARVPSASSTLPAPPAPSVVVAPPPIEVGGRPVSVVVKPGDTLIRIGLETGQNWRDIARWNNLDNPNVLEVGQTLRVLPPGVEFAQAGTRPVAAPGRVDTRPLDGAPPPNAPKPEGAPGAVVPPVVAAASAPALAAAPPAPGAPKDPDEDVGWIWPAAGSVTTPFDDARSKGLVIAGRAGDPVLAAADGRVVYAGSGLRGYGNLVIIKHNNTFLSAYAHNQSLLVKEDQAVRRGQKIAEMGSSDAERVQLHFEIRRQGKPVDPARYLPSR